MSPKAGPKEELPKGTLYVPPVDKPSAFLVDLDGTLALMNGRSPYDESCVDQDLPNRPVICVVEALVERGMVPIFMSGRTEGCRKDTEFWLMSHVRLWPVRDVGILLHMRAADDQRPDHVVKLELFDRHVRDQWNVRVVLDDRNSVVKMWRSIGLTVLQVADGDF